VEFYATLQVALMLEVRELILVVQMFMLSHNSIRVRL